MQRCDHPTTVAVQPAIPAAGTPGFFTDGDAQLGVPPTIVPARHLNAITEELLSVITGEGLTADHADRTQLHQAILRAAARAATGNVLTNPEFRVWQRRGETGVAITSTEAIVGPDRWRFKSGSGGSAGTVSRVNVLGTPTSPSRAEWGLRLQVTAGVGSAEMAQRIESVVTLHGQPVVVAFDAKKNAGADATIASVSLVQRFGTAGDADVSTALTPSAGLLIDGSERRLLFKGTLPSVIGKTFTAGPTGNHNLELRIVFTSGQTFDVILTGFVVSRGTADPGFSGRPFAHELVLCQRHYEKSNGDSQDRDEDTGSFGLWDTVFGLEIESLNRRFTVEKYRGVSAPTVVWFPASPGASNTPNRVTEKTTAITDTDRSVTTQNANVTNVGFPRLDADPGSGTLRYFRANWTAEAEIP
jgi:hypothetical protein